MNEAEKDGSDMGIFSGIVCFICFCLLSAKAATAKLHVEKMDRMFMKMHKPVSAFLMIACVVHIFYSIPLLKNRSLLVVISGFSTTALMILLICFCHMIKDRKKKIWWHRVCTILMAAGILGHFTTYITDFNNYQNIVTHIEIDNINLENVKDGIYRGECDAGYIYARVEVEVRDGAIVSINLLEHRNERGERAEAMIDHVLSEQKIDVDAISGATNSSKVIKKAIENAISER